MTPAPTQRKLNPMAAQPDTTQHPLWDQVAFVIERIRPAVQNDGGDIELVEITPQNAVRIRMHGACVGCPSASMTLRIGIERNLKDRVPGVTAVEAVD